MRSGGAGSLARCHAVWVFPHALMPRWSALPARNPLQLHSAGAPAHTHQYTNQIRPLQLGTKARKAHQSNSHASAAIQNRSLHSTSTLPWLPFLCVSLYCSSMDSRSACMILVRTGRALVPVVHSFRYSGWSLAIRQALALGPHGRSYRHCELLCCRSPGRGSQDPHHSSKASALRVRRTHLELLRVYPPGCEDKWRVGPVCMSGVEKLSFQSAKIKCTFICCMRVYNANTTMLQDIEC